MTARNAPCPCGSGKKYKRCHGRQSPPGRADVSDASAVRQRVQDLTASGRIDEAITLAERLPVGPSRAEMLVPLYLQRWATGDDARARALLQRWCRERSDQPEPWRHLVELKLRVNRLEAAARALVTLRKRAPGAEATHHFGGILAQLAGDIEAAMAAYGQAAAARTPMPLTDAEREAEAAVDLLATAAGHYPGSPGARSSTLADQPVVLQRAAQALDRWQSGWSESRGPLSTDQVRRYGFARYNLGCEFMNGVSRVDEATRQFENAIEIAPDLEHARVNRALMLNYTPGLSPESISTHHRDLGRWYRRVVGPPHSYPEASPLDGRPLRVGYLSCDFRWHSVAFFALPVLERHDPASVRAYAYSGGREADEVTDRVRKAVAGFREVAGMDDDALLETIRRDRIDVLVELTGLTRGHRLGVLARRAAPVQVSWIGYPNTTGLDTVDYRIVDRVTDPPGRTDHWHTERLVHMPHTFSVYDPLGEMPDVAPPPSERRGYVTFGSMNHVRKLGEGVLGAWAEILDRVPESRLLIKNVSLDLDAAADRLRAALEKLGVDAARVRLVGRTPGRTAHLETYGEVDIALDSFPYHGTTTTCESLYMGVPVVTLAGEDHRGRVGVSQLTAVGLESLVAESVEAYVEKAVALATDADRLASLRAGLRDRMRASPLMDAAGFTRDFEGALRAIWSSRSGA